MLLIALNVCVFIWELSVGVQRSVFALGAVPAEMLNPRQYLAPDVPLTVMTSMFMHGGFLHLGGNMLYLWIFGNNIEDWLGHVRFLLFYLAGGIVAAYSHAFMINGSTIPMVGASGAVSAVLGAYLLLYPRARVLTLVFLGFFVTVIRLPALIVIGFWAIIQFVSGLSTMESDVSGGVAWFAHIGGFIFGIMIVMLNKRKRKTRRLKTW